ncbi:hypothetical protein EOL96_03295 [Candidatus Saccharibacteria bacterium]|nr:hypothetical protein [Candidatus Saccharibacteria bacterium]
MARKHDSLTPQARVASRMANGAVSLCEGCPMARLCSVKDPIACPPVSEMPGGDGGREMQALPQPPRSYMSELMNDSILTVNAGENLPDKKITPKPVIRKKQQTPSVKPSKDKPRVKRVPMKKETLPENVAEFFFALVGVKSLATTRAKK